MRIIFNSSVNESNNAFSFIGLTTPDVPNIDKPPLMPNLGLKVFAANSWPSGMEIVTRIDLWGIISRTASAIIFRGTGFIAGSPTGTFRPGNVTTPTPSPAANKISPSPSIISTWAKTFTPLVISALSSPESLITPKKF